MHCVRYKFTAAYLFSAENNASKIAVFFMAVLIRQNWVYSICPSKLFVKV